MRHPKLQPLLGPLEGIVQICSIEKSAYIFGFAPCTLEQVTIRLTGFRLACDPIFERTPLAHKGLVGDVDHSVCFLRRLVWLPWVSQEIDVQSCKCLQYWDECLPRPGRPDTDPLQRLWSPHRLTAGFRTALIGNGAE